MKHLKSLIMNTPPPDIFFLESIKTIVNGIIKESSKIKLCHVGIQTGDSFFLQYGHLHEPSI